LNRGGGGGRGGGWGRGEANGMALKIQLSCFEILILTEKRDFRAVFVCCNCSLPFDAQAHRMKKKLNTINIEMS